MKNKEYSRTKNSALNITTGLGSQVAMSVLHFIARTIFIQVLGPSYLGIGGLFKNILTLLSLTNLGLDTAINFKLYRPLADKDEKRVRILMKFYKQAYIVIGTVILVLGLLAIPLLPVLIKDYDKLDTLGINAPLVFLLYLFQSISSYWFFAYRSTIIKTAQKKYVINIISFFVELVTVILQIAVLLIFGDFLWYIAIVIVTTLIGNVITAVIAHRMYPYAFEQEAESITKEERRNIFKDCGALFVFKISRVVLKTTDNFVISSVIGLASVGLYANYLMFYTTINQLIGHFYGGVKASMGNIYAKDGIEKSYFMFEVMNFMTILLKGTACVGVAVCVNEIIELWIGVDYILPQPFPTLLGIEILFNGLKINLGQVRNISGAFRQAWIRPVWGCILNVALSIYLCQKIGISGVIIGTITADIFANFMVDPRIIHRYSFKNYRPVSYYYKKNLLFLVILAMVGAMDFYLCSLIATPFALLNITLHIFCCLVSVPVVFVVLYWHTEVTQYIYHKMVASRLPIVKQ